MPTRLPIPFGRVIEVNDNIPRGFVGSELLYGSRSNPQLDIVEYKTEYYFTGFGSQWSDAQRLSTYFYNPRDTVPLDPPEDYGQGEDSYVLIERVEFTNGVYQLEGGGSPVAAIKGLYDYLGFEGPIAREGFEFWLDGYESGAASLASIVDDFVRIKSEVAPDPQDNTEFVQLLYREVLGYEVDEEGASFWVNNLDAGLADKSDVLTEIVSYAGAAHVMDPWVAWV